MADLIFYGLLFVDWIN